MGETYATIRQVLKAILGVAAILAAAAGSIGVVSVSVAVFMFAAATSVSDPGEQGELVILFVLMMLAIGGVMGGWYLYFRWLFRGR